MARAPRGVPRVLRAHVREARRDARAAHPEAPGLSDSAPIAVAAQPRCVLCGTTGEVAYRDLRDEPFGVPGAWGFRRCPRDDLWWLDPRPLADEIPKLYLRYCTHDESALRASAASRLWLALAFALRPLPGFRDVAGAERMWLPHRAGRLLDVGAGDGRFLARMRDEGWRVSGVEPDADAVRRARAAYRIALAPSLDTLEDGRFDAVTLNNVIEHVPDPVATLRECWSRLRPGGVLVVLTPNVASLGHRVFGARWRGLEPPRHLYLFSEDSLREIARRAGVERPRIRRTGRAAPFMWASSGRGGLADLAGGALAFVRETLAPALGEELLLIAER